MPFPRRGGRRRPFVNSRWQLRRLETLCLFLSPAVRSTLTAWMKIYGETNDVPGLVSGPIEVRFRRLREHTGADVFLLWTTPERWAAGEALSFWIPAIGLALECRFEDGRLVCDKARPTTQEERDPRRQRSAIGMELRPDNIELPTDASDDNPSAGLVASFERLLDRRWTSFVDPLREALEAEARDDAARAERLATPYAVATPRIGSQSESDPYRLSGVEASAIAAFDEGEWLDLVDTRGRVISSARLVRIDPAEGVMDVDVRGADPPSEGIVRPRPQTQILAQKRAIIEELDNPTGALANAVKLVASPASLHPPQRRRPASFVNRLVGQNRSQMRAVSLALGLEEGQALMVQGPPGTGKSTTLAEVLGQLVMRDKNVTVLVCSHSNHGVDNLLLKTLPYLESIPELAIARVGLFDRVHPLARPHFVPPGEDLGAYNVVFTTVDALALQVEAGARTYDYAVLDEANRASILDSLIPLVRGRRFILVGDHLQLQPVLSEAEEQLRLEPAVGNTSAIGKSLFAWLRERRFPEAATIFLDEQNRMHPVIAGLISEVFYEGKLRSGRRAPRRVADVPLFPSAVTWVDTRGLHGLREARGRGASLVNVPEARLVATIARHILSSSQRQVEVGVISAYAEQTALLRRLLLHRGNQRQNGASNGAANPRNAPLDRTTLKLLEIDTVDAFEGREKDIIIVSLVRSNRRRDIGFLRLMQRINVALSRARTMLIVVGDTSTLRGSYFDRIVRYVRGNGMLVPGPRLIGRLLNARGIERPGERTGERPGVPGRRRRQLPSARTAFPAQDPAAAGAGGAAAEDGESQRGRRRRRRVRGRPGSERPGAERGGTPPSVTMEMGSAAEPGPDEPATQYEIDRFAALVEQLLGDSSSDDAAAGGAEAPAVSEVDRAHAEEVLAEALRAVGQQAERTGSSRSRRGNNRRRSRRGQTRPLPGDAAVADAARRMAREEAEAAAGELAGEGWPDEATATATGGSEPASAPGPARAFEPVEGLVRPGAEPLAAPLPPADEAPGRPARRSRAGQPRRTFTSFEEPTAPVGPEVGASPPAAPSPATPTSLPPVEVAAESAEPAPARPRRTRRSAAVRAPADGAPDVVLPAAPPSPAETGPPAPSAAAAPTSEEPARRTRRRVAAAVEPVTPTVAVPAPVPSPAMPAPAPAPDAATTTDPVRRTRRRVAAAAEPVAPAEATAPAPTLPPDAAPPAEPPSLADAPRPRATRRRTAATMEPAPAPTVEAAPSPAPAGRPRRRVTAASDGPSGDVAPPVPAANGEGSVAPSSSPSPVGVPPAASEPPVGPAGGEPPPRPARGGRRASAATPPPVEPPAVEPVAPAATPASRRRRAPSATESAMATGSVAAPAEPAPPAPARSRRARTATAATLDASSADAATSTNGSAAPGEAAAEPKARRTRRKTAPATTEIPVGDA